MHLQERWNNLCLSFLFRLHNIKKTYKKKDKKTEALRGMQAVVLISTKGEDSQLCIYFRWSKKENNTCIAWKIVQNIDATDYYSLYTHWFSIPPKSKENKKAFLCLFS